MCTHVGASRQWQCRRCRRWDCWRCCCASRTSTWTISSWVLATESALRADGTLRSFGSCCHCYFCWLAHLWWKPLAFCCCWLCCRCCCCCSCFAWLLHSSLRLRCCSTARCCCWKSLTYFCLSLFSLLSVLFLILKRKKIFFYWLLVVVVI